MRPREGEPVNVIFLKFNPDDGTKEGESMPQRMKGESPSDYTKRVQAHFRKKEEGLSNRRKRTYTRNINEGKRSNDPPRATQKGYRIFPNKRGS